MDNVQELRPSEPLTSAADTDIRKLCSSLKHIECIHNLGHLEPSLGSVRDALFGGRFGALEAHDCTKKCVFVSLVLGGRCETCVW